MRLTKLGIFIFLLSGTILCTSCGSEEQSVPLPQKITVVKTLSDDVPIFSEFVGEVYGEKDIPIRARVEGYLEGIYFEEGSIVEKGQLLYSIDPRPYEAKVNAKLSEVAAAETMLVKAKSDLDRYVPLAKLNAVSKRDLDAAQANYDANVSAVEAAKANLSSAEIELGYCQIYSPISGIIGITKARVGDFVGRDPNPIILNTVSETRNVKVRFYLTETDYLYISREYVDRMNDLTEGEDKPARKSNIEIILSDGSTYEHKGTIDFIDRGIDATTGSILVQSNFPNPELILRPGLYAKVRLAAEVIKGAIVVPQRCIMELQGKYSVYVVNDSNVVNARQITAGATIGDLRIVTEGLSAGENIVIDDLQKVKEGMVVIPEVIEFKSKTNQQFN